MKNLTKYTLFIFVCTISLTSTNRVAYAQQVDSLPDENIRLAEQEKQQLSRLLDIRFKNEGINEQTPNISDELLSKYPDYTLKVIKPYQQDGIPRVRWSANMIARQIGIKASIGTKIRKDAVLQLVKACFDPDSLVWQNAAKWLLEFHEADFTKESQKFLGDNLIIEPVRDQVILVVGIANLGVMDRWLRQKSGKHFNALLALARMGDDEAADDSVARIDKVKNIDLRIRKYLHLLGFTRHRIALEYIASYLDSNEGEITKAQSGDYSAPSYKNIALDIIVKYFPECSIKVVDGRRYSKDDFDKASIWLNQR